MTLAGRDAQFDAVEHRLRAEALHHAVQRDRVAVHRPSSRWPACPPGASRVRQPHSSVPMPNAEHATAQPAGVSASTLQAPNAKPAPSSCAKRHA